MAHIATIVLKGLIALIFLIFDAEIALLLSDFS
jgi:hypothetical protein